MSSVAPTQLRLQAGGPLAPDQHVYIERPQDRELLELLRAGEYCNLLTSRQMGKTSLMVRTANQLKEEGVAVAVVDLMVLGLPGDVDGWYRGLLREIRKELQLSVDVDRWWQESEAETPNQRLIRFFREEVASRIKGPVVVFVDEIDLTLALDYTDEFFLALRAMYNERSREPTYRRITFCLVGVATPNELIKHNRATPYNIGKVVELRDFDVERDDLTLLNRAVADDTRVGEAVVQAVCRATGGHPYLTLWVCDELVRRKCQSPDDVRRLVDEMFSSLDGVRSNPHFEQILRFLGGGVEDQLTTLELYRRIRRGKQVPDRTTPAHIALKLSGLVKRDRGGVLVVRNQVYRRLFTDAWAKQAMPPEGKRLRVFKRCAIAAAVLVAITSAAWYELIYPRPHITNLIASDDYKLAKNSHKMLGRVPLYAGKADELWVEFLERRALRDEQAENRDYALLWRLKALSARPTDDLQRRNVNLLAGGDYRNLRASLRHRGSIRMVAFSPHGDVVLTGSDDGTARLWSAETGESLGEPMKHGRVVPPDGLAAATVGCVAFSPRGDVVLTGSDDGTARLWSSKSSKPICEPMKHGATVWSVAFSPQGDVVLTGSDDGTARLWSAETGHFIREVKHDSSVTSVAFSTLGVVLTGSTDNTARLWLAETGEPIGKAMRHEATVRAVAFSTLGDVVLTGSEDGTARLWSAETGKPIVEPMKHGLEGRPDGRPATVRSVAFSPRGDVVLTGSSDGMARLWNAETGEPIGEAMRHGASVRAVAFSPQRDVVLTGSEDGTARLWNATTGRPIGEVMKHGDWVRSVAFSPRGDVVLTGSADGTARLWSTTTDNPIDDVMKHKDSIWAVALSRQGDRMLTGSDDRTAQLWNTDTREPIGKPMKHGDRIRAAAFSPRGDMVLTGSEDGMARLWSAETGEPIGEPMNHESPVWSVAFGPAGSDLVVTGAWDGTARLWSVTTRQSNGKAMEHKSMVWCVAFSPQGDAVLTGYNDGTARLWSVATRQPIGEIMKHGESVWDAAFSPQGDMVLTGSHDRKARLWRAETGLPIGEPKTAQPIGEAIYGKSIRSVAYSPDRQWAIVTTEWWAHLCQIDRSGVKTTASRLLPGMLPAYSKPHFLDKPSDGVRLAIRPTVNSVRLVTLRFDGGDTSPIEGLPAELLTEWEAKLGLKINDNTGVIEPLYSTFEIPDRRPSASR